jgi:O-methyltransferase involved in polyketide biosynthesis
MIKVKDEKGLVRDPFSKAILNIDTTALQEHRRKKSGAVQLLTDRNLIESLLNRVDYLEKQVQLLINNQKE